MLEATLPTPLFDPAQDPTVVALRDAPFAHALAVYLELARDGDGGCADTPALALREQARAGRLDQSHTAGLVAALHAAPNLLCVGHLAKAAAAIGRPAQAAAEPLVAHLEQLPITDDVDYWSFDGALWALGFLGGNIANACVHALAAEKPSRAVRSQSIYRGCMPKPRRAELFAIALSNATRLLHIPDPGVWRARFMTIKAPPQPTGPQRPSAARAWELRATP